MRLTVDSVTKRYRAKSHLLNLLRNRDASNHEKSGQLIIKDLTVKLDSSDILCVVGPNGAGKSTLAKILAGTSPVDSGRIEFRGRIVPFLELGAAFLSELNGRDNVMLNGVLLGLKRKYLRDKMEAIFDFAELRGFEYTSLKHYSSGMLMRLAFAIAMHAEGDLYIFDEVLAVGDTRFQQKCLTSFRRLVENGKTLVIITHDMGVVKQYAKKILIVKDGRHKLLTDSRDVETFDQEMLYSI
jgi:ABC-2 type transport system ATP-binding protein